MFLTFLYPFIVNAYSNKIYAGGESIGIELKSNYVLVVGSYGNNKSLQVGDKIVSVDDKKVNNIKELSENVNGKKSAKIGFIRNNKLEEETINIKYENGIYKTGLYVKDAIMGIGTLTYIDPATNIFGSLGHEISEKTTKKIFDASDGEIFSSDVSKIIKSKNGSPGEKVAKFNTDDIYGEIFKNTIKGVFGVYTNKLENKKLYDVSNDIKLGKAKILTTIEKDKIEEFDINILKLSNKNDNHDILFEITDSKLLDKTNGIVQGMSGSPIIQGNNIVGAVTHVIVDNANRGYGILIEKMLKEGENWFNN